MLNIKKIGMYVFLKFHTQQIVYPFKFDYNFIVLYLKYIYYYAKYKYICKNKFKTSFKKCKIKKWTDYMLVNTHFRL